MIFAACFFSVLNTEGFQLTGSILLAFSLYASACSFRDYYNPMLQGLLVIALLISFFYFLTKTNAADWQFPLVTEENQGLLPVSGMVQAAIVHILCLLANVIYMSIGFGKARMPDYNKAFSVSLKNRPAGLEQQKP
jgi:hypothetical protein